jgi:SAM-dependent methyltransferase
MELSELPEHARRNRAEWQRWSEEYVEPGRRRWAAEEPDWGMWDVPERELNVLPDVAGKDVLELGCGTAYWSAWLARRGARVVGLDLTERQLETARRFQQEFDLEFPLIHASAEDVPLPNDTFDLVLSEYGASIWCDPERWVAEAARVLRPGGLLVFLVNGTILMLCLPDEDEELPAGDHLLRNYFGIYRFEWKSDESVDFHLGYGDWIRLLRRKGFEVENLIEVRAPEGAPPNRFNLASPEWARRWPSEEIWVARKRA